MVRGKSVLICGGGMGIGRGVAKAFAAEGARVMVSDRHLGLAEETAGLLRAAGGEAEAFACDVRSCDQVHALVKYTAAHWGGLDIVIQNAGVLPNTPLLELPEQEIRETLEVNLLSAFWVTQAAVPELRKAPGGGRLIFTSSICGNHTAIVGKAHYAASKAGLNGFILNAALELAPLGITVNGVEPGLVAFERHTASGDFVGQMVNHIPLGRPGSAEDIAGAMLYFASPAAAYVTGRTLVVDGGLTLHHFPPRTPR